MERMGFGDKFMKWVRILYAYRSAEILTNGITSATFGLYRRTCQGCLLSPLLFTLVTEALAMEIRNHTHFRYYNWLFRTPYFIIHRWYNYILFLCLALPCLNLIEMFGELLGYRINNSKSCCCSFIKQKGFSSQFSHPHKKVSLILGSKLQYNC